MNPWQGFRQVQSILQAAVWPGSAATVFATGSVVVSASPAPQVFDSLRMPIVLMRPLGAQSDPDHDQEPDLLQQELAITIAQMVPGDAVGEHALMGAGRQTNSAQGRGLLEIEERVLDELAVVDELEGLNILLRLRSMPSADVQDANYIVWRDYLFELVCTSTRTYESAGKLEASETGGTITLTWSLPTARYDISSCVLRRASGSTAPASVTAGTGIVLSDDLAVTVDDTPGSGTWSYSLFVVYDDGTSDARTVTVEVS